MSPLVQERSTRGLEPRLAAEVRDVEFHYGDCHVLTTLRLEVPERSVLAFIGPSGCGKSTALRLLNRTNELVSAQSRLSGEVLYRGRSVYEPGVDLRRLRERIGMVFQRPNPFPKSVYDNVAWGPRSTGVRDRSSLDEIVESSLKAAALWETVRDRLHRPALSLSGGQQQRLCIARALAVGPDLLLMDEPTSALDPIATQKIEDLIDELKREYTIVIVTHNMQQAARISDRTAFFLAEEAHGPSTIVETGPSEKIFTNPADSRTEAYITGRFG
ncbi:MAG: phosphate ABC transporter ATP-binding protein [Actinobacteria bacterium]|nr:MAG: phosphate ABC transporter ATP-binding protein [Actinomycetota bacterium]